MNIVIIYWKQEKRKLENVFHEIDENSASYGLKKVFKSFKTNKIFCKVNKIAVKQNLKDNLSNYH